MGSTCCGSNAGVAEVVTAIDSVGVTAACSSALWPEQPARSATAASAGIILNFTPGSFTFVGTGGKFTSLERMRFPELEELKNRRTLKWTRYAEDVLPLWVAESDFGTCPPLKEALADAVEREVFGYPPDETGLADALSGFYDRRYGFAPQPENVFAIPDVVRGLQLAVEHFTKPGSAIIVPTPAYPPFIELPKVTGRQAVYIDAYTYDLKDIEKAFAEGAGSLLFCNPHNPLGTVFSEDYIRDLTDLAVKYDARIIVDEIHAPLVYGGKHVVAAGVSPNAAKSCLTITATSCLPP